MRWFLGALCLLATALPAQQPVAPPPDSARADTARPSPAPAPPTPEQARYLRGLRTASRGVAQLKDGVNRVARSQSGRDTLVQRQAGRRLAGLCSAANSFLANGRAQMRPTAYEDSTRIQARALVTQIDSLLGVLPGCEQGAGRTPEKVANELQVRLRAYDAALRTFRSSTGSPARPQQ